MRFAYIDSNGNEVPIPSVDALALRIELGAITDTTQLYDAQADQWGPADTHEIFHTLARSAGSDDGFVAPPPVAPEPVPPPPAPEAEAVAPESGDVPLSFDAPGAVDSELTLAEPPTPSEPEDPAAGLDLTLAEAAPVAESPASSSPEAEDLGLGGLDLAPAQESEAPEAPATNPDPAADAEDGDSTGEGGFDFGDMDGGLELEDALGQASGGDDAGDGAMDFSGGFGEGMGMGESPDFSGGLELEDAMDFSLGTPEGGVGDSLDLETPMSQFTPEDPPAWMDGDTGSSDDSDVMDFSSVSDESGEPDVPLRDRRTAKNRPSKPRLRRQSAMAGPIVGVVLLLAVAVGGYAAWPALSARFFGPGTPEPAGVVLPPLSEELEPQMRELAGEALAVLYAEVRSGWASGEPVAAPSREWLGGMYLANASQYEGVEAFWNGMEARLVGVEGIDVASFDAAFQARAAASGVSGDAAAAMRERATAGFVAGREDRAVIYGQIERLVDAALELHSFLLANEANIEYVPASSGTTDPVLEANPATPELREAMEGYIDTITRVLGELTFMEQVTADGLWEHVLAEVQQVGIR